MKIGSHNILLKRSVQNNDFDANTFDDYLNFQVKFFIPGDAMRRGSMLKFPMETRIEIDISHPNLKAFEQKYLLIDTLVML